MARRAATVVVCIAIAAAVYAGVRGWVSSAPDVTFVSLAGERITTADLRGRVAVVTFWATDCGVCRKEMPALVNVYEEYRSKGLEMVAVAMKYDPPNYVLKYVQEHPLPFPVALDPTGAIASAFGGVKATPTTVVIDRRGRIQEWMQGEPDFQELRALIQRKLAEHA